MAKPELIGWKDSAARTVCLRRTSMGRPPESVPNILLGGSGPDRLVGEAGDDTLGGGPGRDVILGMSGDDLINGATGNDRANGGEHIAGDICVSIERATGCEL